MSVTVPTQEPVRVVQGTTWQWTRLDLSDFPSSDWSLAYRFHSQNPANSFTITAAQSGTGFSVSVNPTTTANQTPSDRQLGHSGYVWQAIVTHGGTGEKHVVARGVLDVEADLAAQDATYDPRTDAEKRRDELVMALKTITPFKSYTFTGGREVEYGDRAKLVAELSHVKEEIRREQAAKNQGVDADAFAHKPIHTRFL